MIAARTCVSDEIVSLRERGDLGTHRPNGTAQRSCRPRWEPGSLLCPPLGGPLGCGALLIPRLKLLAAGPGAPRRKGGLCCGAAAIRQLPPRRDSNGEAPPPAP